MARNQTFFSIAVVAAVVSICHAAITPEDYWNFMLPNTPTPNSIRERLQPDIIDEKTGTTVNVGKGGVNVNTGKGKPQGGTTVGVGRKGVGVNTGHGNTHVNVSKGDVNVNTGHKGKPVVVTAKLGVQSGRFAYNVYIHSSGDQLYDPNVVLFFFKKDLHPGTKLNMFFQKATKSPNFLPRSEANKIPFSSSKFPEILKQFSAERDSQDAQSMMETIKQCEEPAMKGEAKQCVTSLESMVDFAMSKLGTDVKALATEVKKETVKQQYTIAPGVHKLASNKLVACHIENYVYAVYYCHEISDTSAYVVPLVGEDKTRVDAVAVCHKDTSQWNPKHVAFKVLKVKPGSVPICHFSPADDIVWVQN